MKKILIIFSLFFILAVGFFIVSKSFMAKKSSPTPQPALGANQNFADLQQIILGDKAYAVAFIRVERPDFLQLIPNFSDKLTASEVKEKYACQAVVNAGFYLGDATPAGLFITEGTTVKKWRSNMLFNGVLSINDLAVPRITFEPPRDHLRIAVQTGPVLMENGNYLKLTLNSDKPSRRVIAAITGDNLLYFLVIYNADQAFDGPYLADLPAALTEIQKESGITFADTVNLDGGAASTFLTEEVKLSEISPVGSFFCSK